MSSKILLALDIGGGGVRALAVEVESGRLWAASQRVRHPVAPGTEGWGYDLDVEALWRAAGLATREVLARAGAGPGGVLAIATTSMRHGLVLVGAAGEVLYAVPNRDARAAGQGMELAAARGAEINGRTGHWPSPIATAARLLWLKENQPQALANGRAALAVSEWLAFRLCGRAAAEPSHAAESSLFDLARGAWATDLIEGLGLPRAIFPEVLAAGSRLGELTAAAAADLGLRAGTPVAVGGADTQCALLGMGAVDPGRLGVVAGTTVPVQLVVDRPTIDASARLWTGCHVLPGRWVLESNAGAAGEVLDWLAALIFPGDALGAARLASEAALSGPGAGGFLSSLGAQIFHASQMGLPVETLSFSHLSASGASNLRHVARAVLEGLAFSVRANVEQITGVAGASGAPLALAGGLSQSRLWAQILAATLDRPVQVSATPLATPLGAAVCAGVAGGAWADLVAGANRLARPAATVAVDASLKTHYQGLHGDWQRWRAARAEADALAAEAALRGAGQEGSSAGAEVPGAVGFRPKILVTTPFDEASLDRLRALGDVEYCTYIERQRVLTGDDLVESLAGVHALVTEVDIIDADSVARLPDLRVVVSCRSNPVNVDVPACTAYGVPVLYTPGRNALAVAEMTVAMLLALVRRIPAADAFLRQPGAEAGDMARMGIAHESFRGLELHGKTVGIVGFGRIGRAVGALLKAFGANLVAYDPVLSPDEMLRHGALPVSLDALLVEADIVSVHAAVTDDTRGLLGAPQLARMKKGALLVNSARAALVDEAALADALRSGHLGGAALDVFRHEPPPADDPLLGVPNLVATPHIAGNTEEVAAHQGRSVADALEHLLAGRRPETVLNPGTLAAFSWTGERRRPSEAEIEELGKGGGPAISDLEAEEESQAAAAPEPSPAPDLPPPVPAASAASIPAVAVSAPIPTAAAPSPTPSEPPKKGFFKKLFGGRGGVDETAMAGPSPVAPAAPVPVQAGGSARVAEARRKMEAILADFLGRVDRDPAIRDFAHGKDVAVKYVLPDVGLTFYMAFKGEPRSALGEAPEKPPLSLKMNAEILDAVFMERIGGMKAAMSGQMAFSGNTMKAMSLQRIQKDLCRLYAEARAAVGDPGDLTGLAAEAAAPAAAAAAPAAPIASPASPAAAPAAGAHLAAPPTFVRKLAGDERDELVQVVEDLYSRGLLTATGGNISVRRASKPDELWITPSALPKGSLSPDLMVRINLEGEPLDEDARAPSSERLMHARIMAARPDVSAVVHSHGTQAFLLGLTGLPWVPVCTESAFLGELGRVPFLMPGSDELADAAVKTLGQGRAILLLNHGALVATSSLKRGSDMTKTLERTSEVLLTCARLNVKPPALPADLVAQLASLAGSVG
jgi:autoinducer 2 (AI-2) kinase